MIKSGLLDRKITIQTRTSTPGTYGEPIYSWGDDLVVWAAVKYQASKKIYRDDQVTVSQAVSFTIRYRPGLSASKIRVLYNDMTFVLDGVAEIGRREGLLLVGKAKNDG